MPRWPCPFLDAMVPAATALAKTAAQPALRFGAVFVPMGERPGYWTPATTGSGFEFTPILKPIERFRDSVVIVSNLDRPPGGTHAVSTSTWLTGSAPKRTEAEDFYAGISLDQVAAGLIGKDTVFPSLEIATEDQAGYIGACDVGYSCAYMSTIAWQGPTTPLPMEINPRVVFERMFGRPGTAGGSHGAHEGRSEHSRFGAPRRGVARARARAARSRAVERISRPRARDRAAHSARREAGDAKRSSCRRRRSACRRRSKSTSGVMFELMAVAYEADLTRVFTFMMNREASQLVFPNLGINEPWHHTSHHGNEPEKLAALVKINTWQIELFGTFPRPPGEDAGRRRLAARSLADPLRQRHERQQFALGPRRAAAARRARPAAA